MKKRIKVQSKLSMTAVVIISAIIIAIVGVLAYILMTSNDVSYRVEGDIFGLIAMVAIFIPLWIKNAMSKEEYVSELIIDDTTLSLVYKSNKGKRIHQLNLEDIKSVKAVLFASDKITGTYSHMYCKTDVSITTKDNKISFTENSNFSLSFCAYAFLLRLISISKFLPNFKYQIYGNSDIIKKDIEQYVKFGKRLSFAKKASYDFKKYPVFLKVVLGLCIVSFIISIGFPIFLKFPFYVSAADKEYVSYIEQGYKYYQDDLYDKSIQEYDKALTFHDNDSKLYYYRALTYYYNKQYKQAKNEAEKGISCLKRKSVYDNVKHFHFSKSDIGLYTTLGNSEMKLGNYESAIKAYDYIIKKGYSKHNGIYLKRGICKYYLNDKSSALEDFYEEKQIIKEYLHEQKYTQYKDLYPMYSEKDLQNVEHWIDACK